MGRTAAPFPITTFRRSQRCIWCSVFAEVESHFVSVSELLLGIVNEGTSLNELISIVEASPELVALVLLHDHDFGGSEVLTVSLNRKAKEGILLSVVQTSVPM